jgi:hypothetical protein
MNNPFISLEKAIAMTTRYRDNMIGVINPFYADKDVLCISDTFDKEAIQTLINNDQCVSLRLYYGMNADLQIRPIIVGVNSNNEDILPPLSILGTGEITNDIVDDSVKCPPVCPPPSPLNP